MSEDEVLGLANMFDGLEPQDGKVKVSKIKSFFKDKNQPLYENLKTRYRNDDEITFDEYFDLFAEDIVDKKRQFGNVKYDSNAKDVTCGFCPYPQGSDTRDSYRAMSKNI